MKWEFKGSGMANVGLTGIMEFGKWFIRIPSIPYGE